MLSERGATKGNGIEAEDAVLGAQKKLTELYTVLEEQYQNLHEYFDEAKGATELAARKTRRFVEDHPFYSVLGAACLGFVMGMALRRPVPQYIEPAGPRHEH